MEPKKRRSGVGVGTISLMVIFTILCLSVLALLSVSTVQSDRRISERSTDNIIDISAQKGSVAKIIAELDDKLVYLPIMEEEEYFENAMEICEELGFTVYPDRVVEIIFPLSSGALLKTKLEILPQGEKTRYLALEQVIEQSREWVPEEDGTLWLGE